MLIEFKITNFRSIRDTQTLSMVAAPIEESNLIDNIFSSGIKDLGNLVKVVAIYGANASGKSNLIDAMNFMQDFIRDSAKGDQEGEKIDINPFRLDKLSPNLPSEFELLFVAEKILYEYGFALNNQQIVHEWLFAYPQGKAQLWFERIYDEETKQYDWDIKSKQLTDQHEMWKKATHDRSLFLSTVGINNVKLNPAINWIMNNLMISITGSYLPKEFTCNLCKDSNNKQKVLDLLHVFDLNIVDFKLSDGKLIFIHKIDESNKLIEFPEEFESKGIKRLFAFAGYFIKTILEDGGILVIDELDCNLHPSIIKFIVKCVHNPNLNRHNAQIIFTTYDSSILDHNLLRLDQVWFVEKDKYQSTKLYPLTDFKPRLDETLQKGYLEGRYGALPFIGASEVLYNKK